MGSVKGEMGKMGQGALLAEGGARTIQDREEEEIVTLGMFEKVIGKHIVTV